MTTKEIAKAVGKDERSVQRWVKIVGDKMSSVSDKMSASSPNKPANYTLDEVIEIIREGMGDSAAGIFKANTEKTEVAISDKLLQQVRLSVKDGLLSKQEARHILGVERMTKPIQVVENLGRISKQAYAVEMKVRDNNLVKQITDSYPDLFGGLK